MIPTSEVGGVYSYEAIAAGARLRCELRVRQGLALELGAKDARWREGLRGTCRLGRSKKDDFGLAHIELAESGPEAGPVAADPPNLLVVWLLSDALLRNERLQPDPSLEALRRELVERLGVDLKLRDDVGDRLSAIVRTRRIESWQVGWGLPRPSLIVMAAGSCAAFEALGELDMVRCAEVQREGIGGRRAEGYGRVVFNDRLLLGSLLHWDAQPEFKTSADVVIHDQAPDGAALADTGFEQLIERETWRAEIRRQALARAASKISRRELLGLDADGKRPPMSQLGAFRTVVQRMRTAADAEAVRNWLRGLENRPNRRDKWPDGSLALLNRLVDQRGAVWTFLRAEGWPVLSEGARERLQGELWPEAVRAVVDACVRAHKREIEKTGAGHGTTD